MSPLPQGVPSPSRQELLDRLNRARNELGWTLDGLGKRTGGSRTDWSYVFNNKRDIKREKVVLAAIVLGDALDEKIVQRRNIDDVEYVVQLRESLRSFGELWRWAQGEEIAVARTPERSASSTEAPPAGEPSPAMVEVARAAEAPASSTKAPAASEPPPAMVEVARTSETPASSARVLPSRELRLAADRLAVEIWSQWEKEAGQRQLILPRSIPVRWRWSSENGVASDMRLAVNEPRDRRPLFPPLPGVPAATLDTVREGGIQDLFRLYAGVDSGRLVVMSDYGQGKSGSAILLVLDALNHRSALAPAGRAAAPVPVLLTTHGWDPRHEQLETWLVRRLTQDYQTLRADRDGERTCTQLIELGGIALVLDGFDEMHPDLHRAALDQIGRQSTFRLVVLTRRKEFAAAVRGKGHLRAAAVIELRLVPADAAAEYLTACQPVPRAAQWERLVVHLRTHPNGSLTRALSSPLYLTLLRDAFPNPADIDRFLAPGRFADPADVENYLLDRTIDLAFSQDPGMSQPAKIALGYIAFHMNAEKIRDLAWWKMHRWLSPVPRIAAPALLGLLLGVLFGAAAFSTVGKYAVGGRTGSQFGAFYLGAMGLAFGFLAGIVSEFRHALRMRRYNVPVALVGGLASMLAVGNQAGYEFGVPAGLVVAAAAGRVATRKLSAAPGTRRPHAVVTSRLDVPAGVIAAIPIGLAYGITETPLKGLVVSLVTMLTFGLIAGFSRPLTGSDLGSDPQSLWVRERKTCVSFGLTAGLTYALATFAENASPHGPLAGLIAALCFGLLIGLGCTIGASDAWRTKLVFVQLRHTGMPINGMRFLQMAHDRQILRTVGPLYQFRHPQLQDRLASSYALSSRRRARRLSRLTILAGPDRAPSSHRSYGNENGHPEPTTPVDDNRRQPSSERGTGSGRPV